MILDLLLVLPGREPARFSIISVVCEAELGANQENLPVQHEYSAIIPHPSVTTGIPTSQTISSVSSPLSKSARHSQECSVVSSSKKWSSQPYPGNSSSGPTRYRAPSFWLSISTTLREPGYLEVQCPLIESTGGKTRYLIAREFHLTSSSQPFVAPSDLVCVFR